MSATAELAPPQRDRAAVAAAVRRLRLVNNLDWSTSREVCDRVLAWLRADRP